MLLSCPSVGESCCTAVFLCLFWYYKPQCEGRKGAGEEPVEFRGREEAGGGRANVPRSAAEATQSFCHIPATMPKNTKYMSNTFAGGGGWEGNAWGVCACLPASVCKSVCLQGRCCLPKMHPMSSPSSVPNAKSRMRGEEEEEERLGCPRACTEARLLSCERMG